MFASRFPLSNGESLWTVVNRVGANTTGPQLHVPLNASLHYYDCYHGVELLPFQADANASSSSSSSSSSGGSVSLQFDMESNGYGCVFATPEPFNFHESSSSSRAPVRVSLVDAVTGMPHSSAPAQPTTLPALLTLMQQLTARPLESCVACCCCWLLLLLLLL